MDLKLHAMTVMNFEGNAFCGIIAPYKKHLIKPLAIPPDSQQDDSPAAGYVRVHA
ncbi:MAG: hypothetical protein NTY60_09875 [Proteobacteria bacterium]|nr:hypothetical protein [Pseudomonadota bacterium]